MHSPFNDDPANRGLEPLTQDGPTIVRDRHGPADPASAPAYLVFVEGPAAGTLTQLSTGSCVLGRGDTADVKLDDKTVSREHARFVLGENGAVYVLDLGTTNGTFVNADRSAQAELREGDHIEIGATIIRFTRRKPLAQRATRRDLAASRRAQILELSPRQLEVARLVVDGLSNAEIGQQLQISPRTVSTHLEHIYDRLEIRSRVELVKLMSQAGMLDEGAA
ncbi:MAG: FHA domain-containing protein [Myxococcales bacterium FL481]|nr:MAG: FHA domain-containing protein [Myxococcales bacterium FL481]